MDSSLPLTIRGASQELRRLKRKVADNEELNELETEDFEYLQEYVREYSTHYMLLDYDICLAYELWGEYLADQRTYSGTLLLDQVFALLDRIQVSRELDPDEYMRLVRRIKRVDQIVVQYAHDDKKDEPPPEGDETET